MAKLYFYYGTMFSAKSAKLIIMIHNFKERGRKPLVLTSSLDTRFGSSGELHSRIPGLSAKGVPVSSEKENFTDLIALFKSHKDCDVIFVDEVHFFLPEQIDQLCDLVDSYNVNVFSFGLRSTFKGTLFPATERLFAMADTIRENKTTCECGKKATINALLDSQGRVIIEGDDIHVGDTEYAAYCRKCWKSRIVV